MLSTASFSLLETPCGRFVSARTAQLCFNGVINRLLFYLGNPRRPFRSGSERKELYGEDVELVFYDVKYVLGGTEKRVKATYISCTPNDIVARQPRPRDRFTVPVAEVGREGVVEREGGGRERGEGGRGDLGGRSRREEGK